MHNRRLVLVLLATVAFTADVSAGTDLKAECGAAGALKVFRIQLPRLDAGPGVPQVRVATGSPVDLVFVSQSQNALEPPQDPSEELDLAAMEEQQRRLQPLHDELAASMKRCSAPAPEFSSSSRRRRP